MRGYKTGENNKSQNWCHFCILEGDLSTHMTYFFLPHASMPNTGKVISKQQSDPAR